MHLSISLLGSFQVALDRRPVTDFRSNKDRALLAYLAVEAGHPHRRETLAGLLWPEWPNRGAMSNLRYALSHLRGTIGDRVADPPYLLITRDTLELNPDGDHSVDVAVFREATAALTGGVVDIDRLRQAATTYGGPFMAGLSLGDCPAYEEWMLLTRERLGQQMAAALHALSLAYEQRGELEEAQSWAWRLVELEPWDERGHQQLMRALARLGQRAAALARYETCRRLLRDEMGVEPSAETTLLYEQIRTGRLGSGDTRAISSTGPVSLPPFFEAQPRQEDRAVFVARQRESSRLDEFLAQSLAGRGRVVFITGEAGSGKTALIRAFTRQAQQVHPELLVAEGISSAYTGVGDPYLPFRQILELLTGDVEAKWAAGAITREHARRLWTSLPVVVRALVEHGPDLIDTFVLRAGLLGRAAACTAGRPDWLVRLKQVLERPSDGPESPGPSQSALFEQYASVLRNVAAQAPLVLVLDDLQWADAGSISMLFHLGRQVGGSRLLIIGAYRPEDVALGRAGSRHPLDTVINELRRDFGDVVLNLDQAEGRAFVHALVDSEPNQLSDGFRGMLYRQTRGQPLFTVELLRGLQERGDLVQDDEGHWIEKPALDWETLPARVEAVIRERIDRLAPPLRGALQVASVEGEQFTAEVVAQVRGTDEGTVLTYLSDELDRRHRLVRAESIARVDDHLLSRYSFRHILFQKYLYGELDEVQRVHLHRQVATALEGLYPSPVGRLDIAPQLARHFQEAGMIEKAITYLREAGDRAIRLSAYHEGIAHLMRALDLLMTLPDTPDRAQQELAIQLSLGVAWMDTAAPERQRAFRRVMELCQQMGQVSLLSRSLGLGGLVVIAYVHGDYQRARELAEETLALAEEAQNPLLSALSHWYLGFVFCALGAYTEARAHLAETLAFHSPDNQQAFVALRGSDAGLSAMAYDACCLWCLGYPDQAVARSRHAIRLARELGHGFTLADVLCYGGCTIRWMLRDAETLRSYSQELLGLSREIGFEAWSGEATAYAGTASILLGDLEEGIADLREGTSSDLARGMRCYIPGMLAVMAEALAQAGCLEEGLATLGRAFALLEKSGEGFSAPELHRINASLLLLRGDEAGAEASLRTAIDIARQQQAKSWELRSALALSRLWLQQGRPDEARKLLSGIYDWFTEGFTMPDLVAARALLDELIP